MHVVFQVDGRDAVPIRAIPFLTDWRELTPGVLVHLLAGDEDLFAPFQLAAWRVEEGGRVVEITSRFWIEKMREAAALGEEVSAAHIGVESQRQRWRRDVLRVLPAGTFVWREDLDRFVERMVSAKSLLGAKPSGVLDDSLLDDDLEDADAARHALRQHAQLAERYRLDYHAFVEAEFAAMVREGFDASPGGPARIDGVVQLMDEIERIRERMEGLERSGRQSSAEGAVEHQHLLDRLEDLEQRKRWMRGDAVDPVEFREGFLRVRVGATVWDRWSRFSSVKLEHAAQLLDKIDPDGVPLRSASHAMLSTLIEATGGGQPRRLSEWLRALVEFEASDSHADKDQARAPRAQPPESPPSTGAAGDGDSGVADAPPMKRRALVDKHKGLWPSIDRDLKDASTNGLALARAPGTSGWNEKKAVDWARSRGKLKDLRWPATPVWPARE